jgi:hypothetical protein
MREEEFPHKGQLASEAAVPATIVMTFASAAT